MKSESWTVPLIGGEMYLEVGPTGLLYESALVRDDGESQEAIRHLKPAEVKRLAGLIDCEPSGVMNAIQAKWPDLHGLYGFLIENDLGVGFVW